MLRGNHASTAQHCNALFANGDIGRINAHLDRELDKKSRTVLRDFGGDPVVTITLVKAEVGLISPRRQAV